MTSQARHAFQARSYIIRSLNISRGRQKIKDINTCHNFKVHQKYLKVRHHNHYSGEFKNVLCNSCNLKEGHKIKFVPIYFHNLNYDSHLFIKKLISDLYIEGKIVNIESLINCIDNHDFTADPENEDELIIKNKQRFAKLSETELEYEKIQLLNDFFLDAYHIREDVIAIIIVSLCKSKHFYFRELM